MSGYEEQEVSTNNIPRLYGQENFTKWKVLFEAAVCYNDVDMWKSIKEGPQGIEEDGANPTATAAVRERMRKVDDKALAMLKLALSWEILTKVAHHTTAKKMYDAILEMFEGNTELKNIKKQRLKQQLERFKYKDGERLKSILERFLAIVNDLRTTDYVMTDFDLNTKLLNSMPKEWYTTCKFILQKPNFNDLKLDDVVCFLQAAEIEMIENEMIKEEKPCFNLSNALIAPMGNLTTKNQQQIPIIEEPVEHSNDTPKSFVGGSTSSHGNQQRFNVQLIDDTDTASMASGQIPHTGSGNGQGSET
ncbi:uncharacterized protein LOC143610525 [Bidens hawaiensis]|uniref:uncharacterized protein LOC143610525 n=1 Tax=Bidens hawaiensis TaxID=980011 RepID=UPI00404AED7B